MGELSTGRTDSSYCSSTPLNWTGRLAVLEQKHLYTIAAINAPPTTITTTAIAILAPSLRPPSSSSSSGGAHEAE